MMSTRLFGEVLGYDFWGIPAETIMQASLDCYNSHKHWLDVLSKHKDKRLRDITAWFVGLAKRSKLEPMEYVLDQLIGTGDDGIDSEYDDLLLPKAKPRASSSSPFKSYYFSSERYDKHTDTYLTLLGQLSTLRHRLRQWKPLQALYISDLVEFVDLHRCRPD